MKIYLKKDASVVVFFEDLVKDTEFVITHIDQFNDFDKINLCEHHQIIVCSYESFNQLEEPLVNKIDKGLVKFIIMDPELSIEDKIKILSCNWCFIEIGDIASVEGDLGRYYYALLQLEIKRNIKLILQSEKINKMMIDSFQIVVNGIKLEESYKKIQVLNEELEYMSKTDELTKVLNRRAIFDFMKNQIAQDSSVSESKGRRNSDRIVNNSSCATDDLEWNVFSCAIIDIDFFKKINDQFGHLTGDKVLRRIGELLSDRTIFRAGDIAGRFGGEEFIVILPRTTSKYGVVPMQKFSSIVKKEKFVSDDDTEFGITVSVGLAQARVGDADIKTIVANADKALYHAKETGRDKIVVYEEHFIE